MPYIYRIKNNINGKSYIGKTQYDDPVKRYKEHIDESKRNKKRSCNRAIYRAFRKYGIENFSFEIIEESFGLDNCEREKYYIELYDTFRNGYNETLGGDGRCYIDLNENDVVNFYNAGKTIKETSEHFNCDHKTIKKILLKNNIKIRTGKDSARPIFSKKVAKIDLKTNEILEIFDCIADANIKYKAGNHICDVCNGRRKTCKGYGWKYIE